MKNFILFGPPGIGKSTIIGILKTKGFSALDLEDLYPNRVRFQVPNLVQGKILGAADLNPQRKYNNAEKLLLITTQEDYDQRRRARDAGQTSKANQKHHDVIDWCTPNTFDKVFVTTDQSAEETAEIIANYIKGRF